MALRFTVAILFMCAVACMATTPVIRSITPAHLSTTAADQSITISGDNLPTPDSVWISGIPCTGATMSGSDIICSAAPGLGQDNQITVVYETNKRVSANIVDFEEVGSVTLTSGETDIHLSEGDEVVITISGVHFGMGSETHEMTGYTGNFGVVVQYGFRATILTHDDTTITARLPSYGCAGANLRVSVQLGHQSVEVPNLRVSYQGPVITDVENLPEGTVKRNAMSVRLAIFGKFFGNPSPTIVQTVTVGSHPCVSIHHVSSTELHCTVIGGSGANLAVVIIVNGQSSATASNSLGGSAVRYDFEDTSSMGLDCTPPFGAADITNTELCNCWSGSAPSDNLLSKDCNIHAVCPGRLTTQPVVAQFSPSRPWTEFKDDKLFIKQTAPIVKNRRDTIIQLVVPALSGAHAPNTTAGTVGSSTCFYPGRIWEKRINNLDCLDEYHGVLPWSQYELCGFVEDTSVVLAHRVYKSNLVTSYTETFKKADGKIHFRKISNSYLLTVTFARQVVALTTTPVTAIIVDEDAPTSMDVVVNGDALYDVASKDTIISFTTTMAWPYQVDDITLTGTWHIALDNGATGTVTATAVLNPTQPGELECDQVQDTECEQNWILTIDTLPGGGPQVCNLKGTVEFSTDILQCRDYTTVGDCNGNPSTNFTIQIGKTDLCDDAPDVDASKGIGATLESFYDEELTVPQSVFQTGDMVFFKLTVVDPVSSIDRITFAHIVVTSSTDNTISDELYEQTTPGNDPYTTASEFKYAAHFNITEEFRTPILMANAKGELFFHFRLLRQVLNVVNSLSSATASDMTKQLTVEATVDIAYHGNTKRSVVATTLPAVAHHQLTFYDVSDAEDMEPHANDAALGDDAFSDIFGASPASAVVASVAAVAGAVALVLA